MVVAERELSYLRQSRSFSSTAGVASVTDSTVPHDNLSLSYRRESTIYRAPADYRTDYDIYLVVIFNSRSASRSINLKQA